MKDSIPIFAFYASMGVAYLFFISYVSDKQLLLRFGLQSDAHLRSFHQHVAHGFQTAIHPIFLVTLILSLLIFYTFLPYIDPSLNDTGIIVGSAFGAVVSTAFAVGWFSALFTSRIIKKLDPYMAINTKNRNEALNGIVVMQDTIKVIVYVCEADLTIVVPWSEINEVLVNLRGESKSTGRDNS